MTGEEKFHFLESRGFALAIKNKNQGTFFHERWNSNSLISLYVCHVVPRKDLMHIKL